jgi:hypothetical protein
MHSSSVFLDLQTCGFGESRSGPAATHYGCEPTTMHTQIGTAWSMQLTILFTFV